MMTFENFQSARQWHDDIAAHAEDAEAFAEIGTKGYGYPAGCWIIELGSGRYYVCTGQQELTGTLAECEAFLWDTHAQAGCADL